MDLNFELRVGWLELV